MKKTLLTLTLTVITLFSSAQCTPDPQYIGGGIYPDTITGLSDAIVGQPYYQLITIITPPDTVVLGFNATIDNIDLTNVTGLPPNFTYTCNPSSCSFPGGTTKCAEVFSTIDPTVSDIGLYPITFESTAYVTIALIGGTTQTFITGGYAIEIVDNTTSVIHQFNNETFKLKNIFPNPATNQAKIQFISGKSDDIMFRIYNLMGKLVYLKDIRANRGLNSIDVNISNFPDGIYMYSINNGETVLIKRMVVAN
jgi:hypothetical protein